MSKEAIIQEDLSMAEEFIEALLPTNSRWSPVPSDWLFRGQGDAEWPLIPSALRSEPKAIFGFGTERHPGLYDTNFEQAGAELELIQHVARKMDAQGIPLPGIDPVKRDAHEIILFYCACGCVMRGTCPVKPG